MSSHFLSLLCLCLSLLLVVSPRTGAQINPHPQQAQQERQLHPQQAQQVRNQQQEIPQQKFHQVDQGAEANPQINQQQVRQQQQQPVQHQQPVQQAQPIPQQMREQQPVRVAEHQAANIPHAAGNVHGQQAPAARHQRPPVNPPAYKQGPHISSFPECKDDIQRFCHETAPDSDVAMIECLQDAGEAEEETLTGECEHVIWEFKVNLTQDERFVKGAQHFCAQELKAAPFAECAQPNQEKGKAECDFGCTFPPSLMLHLT